MLVLTEVSGLSSVSVLLLRNGDSARLNLSALSTSQRAISAHTSEEVSTCNHTDVKL